MAQLRRFAIAVAAALLLGGVIHAAPAHRAKAPAPQTHVKLTVAQARAAALKKFPGKVIGKTPLENEEGTWQYGVMVQSGNTLREVMVNAKTGNIDSVEVTTASKEGTEAKAEAAKVKAAPKVAAKPKPAKSTSRPRSKPAPPHGAK